MKRLVALAVLAANSLARPALAAEEAGATEAAAVLDYQRGSALLRAGKFAEALAAFEASMRELPSPNTELLVAHALRELGRRADAQAHYAEVARVAAARIKAGEDRYGPTLADANRWLAAQRPSLSEVAIVIERAPVGMAISVDGAEARTEFDAAAATVRARVWHAPGHAAIAIRAPSGVVEHASADLVAGGASEVRLVFVRESSGPTIRESVVRDEARSTRPPAASLVAAGVAAVALGAFIGFGVDANAAARDLDACRESAGGCPASRFQSVADRGARSATIANVSGVAAGLGLATATVIWVVAARRRPPRAAIAAPPVAIRF